MASSEEVSTVNLLIQPEEGPLPFSVSLWAILPAESGEQILTAPQASWHDFAHRIEQIGLLDNISLGCVDAHVSRREPVLRTISCTRDDLRTLGLGEMLPTHSKRLPNSLLRYSKRLMRMHQGGRMGSGNSQVALLGVRIDNVTLNETVSMIDSMIDAGGYHQIATANVDFLSKAMDDPELREILHSCELVLPDGMPLVWASRLLGTSLIERVTGADLLPHLLELSSRKKRRIFLLGASEERSRAALQHIQREYPNAEICGRMSPPIASLDEMANGEILLRIEEAKPDVLLVAFGNPKQEKWLARHSHCLKVPVCIGVGASFDFLSGQQSRAPIWMQRVGMEWVFRLLSEPRRLGPRYLNNALFLLRYLSVQLMITSVQPRSTGGMNASMTRKDGVVIVRIAGNFTGPEVGQLQQSLEGELANGYSIIVDLTSTSAIRPDAAGLLARLTRKNMSNDVQVWLAGVQPGVRTVLRSTFPADYCFRIAATTRDALHALHAGVEDFNFSALTTYAAPIEHRAASSLFSSKSNWLYQRSVTSPAEQSEAATAD